VTTGGYVIGAQTLGDSIGPLSVAVAWATFYPLAFALLGYLVVRTISLPLGRYIRESWGIIACASIAWAVGFTIQAVAGGLEPWIRMVVCAIAAMGAMLVLLDKWQGFSFRTMKAALAGDKPPTAGGLDQASRLNADRLTP
jgi:hypothetical protein